MTADRALVAIIDDDGSVREALPALLQELGLAVRTFASAEQFLRSADVAGVRVVIADVGLPGMSGPALVRALRDLGLRMPTILMTAQAVDATNDWLGPTGAVACLLKPFGEAALLESIEKALGRT